MIDWKTVDAWEDANIDAGNVACALCVGSGFFAYFAEDQRPGQRGELCGCLAGESMPVAMRRFLASEGYAEATG